MANQWLRLWHDMPNDPKWRTIARVSKQPITLVMSIYIHLLVNASQHVTRGHTDVTTEDIASALDVDESQIDDVLQAMEGRVIDKGVLLGWEKRQPIREETEQNKSTAAERKRKQRAKEKKSQQVTPGHTDVTTCHKKSRIDKDTDKDKEREKNARADDDSIDKKTPIENQAQPENSPKPIHHDPKPVHRDPEPMHRDPLPPGGEPVSVPDDSTQSQPAAQPDLLAKFSMFEGWQPRREEFEALRLKAGLKGVAFTEYELIEFVNYFAGESRHLTQGQWENKLVAQLKANHERKKQFASEPEKPEKTPLDPEQSKLRQLEQKTFGLRQEIVHLESLLKQTPETGKPPLEMQIQNLKSEFRFTKKSLDEFKKKRAIAK